jgi:hypothetical protein
MIPFAFGNENLTLARFTVNLNLVDVIWIVEKLT